MKTVIKDRYVKHVYNKIHRYTKGQSEFHQAAVEVLDSIRLLLNTDPIYEKNRILERILLPERMVIFRVCWHDDTGKIRINSGYRVQFNSALGPYKGGLRFHHSVNLSILKFLGFEQIFKNSLTGLQLGGGKGGANFDPKGKSDNEVMRFCQAFMNELYRHIGDTTDVPAGDIGVGGREIGYLFGQYKKLTRRFDGVLTGKNTSWGGSYLRPEATGYGVVYFANNMLKKVGGDFEGKKCLVSGSGNVSIYTMEKLYHMGATPIACSDSLGTIHDKNGIDVELIKQIKEVQRASLEEYIKVHKDAIYIPILEYPKKQNVIWSIKADCAFPSATQNEISLADAQILYDNGCRLIAEGANMPTTNEAVKFILSKKDFLFAPAKAANAGGVAVSGLEMAQNASMQKWTSQDVDEKLQNIMKSIYTTAYETSKEFNNEGNLVLGANIAGFKKVADSMIQQGHL